MCDLKIPFCIAILLITLNALESISARFQDPWQGRKAAKIASKSRYVFNRVNAP